MKYLLLFIGLVAAGCITQRVYRGDFVGPNPGDENLLKTNPSWSATRFPSSDYEVPSSKGNFNDLSFEELKNILAKNKFSKIEDLLKYLNENKPTYMSHHTLGYASMSLHESSKQFPRAIVFGATGNFIITFNGHSKQSAYDMLEVVEFNQQKKEFEYREIQFNDLGQVPGGKPYQISKIGGPENKCLQCHTNSRPIWESYPAWPGFYGANDDDPIGRSAREPELKLKPSDQYKKEWAWFSENGYRQERYRYLPPMADSLIVGDSYGRRPNTDLSILLGKMNVERIARIIKKKTRPDFRYAYLAAILCREKPYPQALQTIHEEYNPKYEADSINHQVYRAQRLIEDLSYDVNELRQFWDRKYEVYQNQPTPYPKDGTTTQFLKGMLTEQKYYTLTSTIFRPYAILAGMTEKFFPKAQPETWPSALYEGVHKYDTGLGEEADWLKVALIEELFPKPEWENLKALKDTPGTCAELEKRFPKELTVGLGK